MDWFWSRENFDNVRKNQRLLWMFVSPDTQLKQITMMSLVNLSWSRF
jgi:putative NADH-flavin reductase